MSYPYVKSSIPVAGLKVNVYKSSAAGDDTENLPVAVLLVMHGREGNQEDRSMMSIVEGVFTKYNEAKQTEKPKREIVVVTFDQRNHGSRLIDEVRNSGWGPKDQPDGGNDAHAYDMYGMFVGTARDVSFLIDFLPAYLYPNDERTIDQWIASGVSLGGHATWQVLKNEPRVKIAIPIIGSPNLISMYKSRAAERNIPFAPPYIPQSFLSFMTAEDAASAPATSVSPFNPFLDKRILILSGGLDEVVPHSSGTAFIESLEVGEKGVKKVIVQPDAGHECTPAMVKALAEFIWNQGIGPQTTL